MKSSSINSEGVRFCGWISIKDRNAFLLWNGFPALAILAHEHSMRPPDGGRITLQGDANTMEHTMMKAVVLSTFGEPEVLEYREVARPAPGFGEVLVEICCCGVCH